MMYLITAHMKGSVNGGAAYRKVLSVAHCAAWFWTGYDPSAGSVQVRTQPLISDEIR